MSDLDPFTDQAFVSRLQKLVSMLSSEQSAEAEAARLKLIEHLRGQRLSLTDIAMRLSDPPRQAASFTRDAREMGLERQLSIARSARHEAEIALSQAVARGNELQLALQRAAFDVGAALQARARVRAFAAFAWAVAALSLALAGVLAWDRLAAPRAARPDVALPARPAPASGAFAERFRLAPGERMGQAAVQDLALRLQPNDDADVRAFLNMGEPVVIERHEIVGTQVWLFVRSQSAAGFVRSGDILRY